MVVIQACFFWVEKDVIFLESKEPAEVAGVVVCGYPLYDAIILITNKL